jgi:hypothetical protein
MPSDSMEPLYRQWERETQEREAPEQQASAAPRAAEEPPTAQSVGSGDYLVCQGDCISSIAMDSGHFWKTIWNDPANAELKQTRRSPHLLLPGDRVTVPPIRVREESGQTETHHRFRRRGTPEKLRIRLLDAEDQPRAGVHYVLEIDGQTLQGDTDRQGQLQVPIAPNARRGALRLPQTGEEFPIRLGQIDPIDSLSGVQARLNNLGYPCGEADGRMTAQTAAAIRSFQAQCGLEQTGRLDETTRRRLADQYGC